MQGRVFLTVSALALVANAPANAQQSGQFQQADQNKDGFVSQ